MSFIESITGIFKNEKKHQTLENLLPVLSFEKDLMVMKNGRVAIGFSFDGVDYLGIGCVGLNQHIHDLPFHIL